MNRVSRCNHPAFTDFLFTHYFKRKLELWGALLAACPCRWPQCITLPTNPCIPLCAGSEHGGVPGRFVSVEKQAWFSETATSVEEIHATALDVARAGETGRGFAMVADEVRKLAEKPMIATKEVGDAIRGIQNGTRKSIGNLGRAASTIEDATALANTSGEYLREIVVLVDQASDQVRSIAKASEQQSAASEEINRSIEQVATISAETVQTMEQASHAVSELTQQVQVLSDLIEKMEAGALDEFLNRWRAESSFIAKNALAEEFLTQEQASAQQDMSKMLKEISLKSEFIEAAFIFDRSGKTRLLYNHGKEGPSLDLHERPYVKDARAGRTGASPAPFQSHLTGNFLMAFSHPVFKGQMVVGWMAISITLGANMKKYLQKRAA